MEEPRKYPPFRGAWCMWDGRWSYCEYDRLADYVLRSLATHSTLVLIRADSQHPPAEAGPLPA